MRRLLSREGADTDFIMCIGDDKTDEDMYEEIKKYEESLRESNVEEEEKKKKFYSIVVEEQPSRADYFLESQRAVVTLLKKLSEVQS